MEYNVQKEARVWNRVMGGESGCSCTGGLSPETLKTLAEAEQAASCLYPAAAMRLCPKVQGQLRRLAEDSRCRMRNLAAVYFVLTGQKLCLSPAPRPCITCTAESLRLSYKELLSRREQYTALAKQEDFSHSFHDLACSAAQTAKELLCVLALAI